MSKGQFSPGLRSAALAAGEAFYFTGKPCVRGHTDRRHAKDGRCVVCRLENNKVLPQKWHKKNRDKHRASCKKRYEENKEEYARAVKEYRNRDREKFRASKRDYYARNAERLRAWFNSRHTRIRRAGKGSYTAKDVADIRNTQKGRCVYCRCLLANSGEHIDHIVAVSRGGTNDKSNIQLLCPSCNMSKGAKDAFIFAKLKKREHLPTKPSRKPVTQARAKPRN